jgi:hypothetical protein
MHSKKTLKMKNTIPQNDLNLELKSFNNLPKLYNKGNITHRLQRKNKIIVKDFFIEFTKSQNYTPNEIIIIKRESIDTFSIIKIKELIKKKCIGCLIKSSGKWFKANISLTNNESLKIQVLKKIDSLAELDTIEYLQKTIQKLKIKSISRKIINKYITNYIEYNLTHN